MHRASTSQVQQGLPRGDSRERIFDLQQHEQRELRRQVQQQQQQQQLGSRQGSALDGSSALSGSTEYRVHVTPQPASGQKRAAEARFAGSSVPLEHMHVPPQWRGTGADFVGTPPAGSFHSLQTISDDGTGGGAIAANIEMQRSHGSMRDLGRRSGEYSHTPVAARSWSGFRRQPAAHQLPRSLTEGPTAGKSLPLLCSADN